MKNTFLILYSIFLIISLSSCKNEESRATNSIRGVWEVTDITSTYGHFFENGFNSSETISEMGELGKFEFSEDSVAFEFTRNDTLYAGNDAWSISSEKVNAGFFRETQYTLIIENHFVLEVNFGDGTKNSEKNAKSAIFIKTPSIGYGVAVELTLEKQ